jgi:hypothetical protein
MTLLLWAYYVLAFSNTMRISDLEDNLCAHIWARIHRRELTGSGLSRDAGFLQAHMSNFLNAPRGLSPEAMDRLLDVLQVDVLDLADPEELRLRALQRPERASSFDSVPLVSLRDASFTPSILLRQFLDSLKFRKRFLNHLKPDTIGDRSQWLRFVMVRADAGSVRAMSPRLALGAVVLLDRHFNSLRPYHRGMVCRAVRRAVHHPTPRPSLRAESSSGLAMKTGRWSWPKLVSAKAALSTS